MNIIKETRIEMTKVQTAEPQNRSSMFNTNLIILFTLSGALIIFMTGIAPGILSGISSTIFWTVNPLLISITVMFAAISLTTSD